jgi:hypothetical protein
MCDLSLPASERERAQKILNLAFHFVKLQSMVDAMRKAINELILLSNENEVLDLQIELRFGIGLSVNG